MQPPLNRTVSTAGVTSDRDPLASFLVGFCMLAAGVVSAAGLAIAFAGDYFTTFVDLPAPLVAVVFLLLFVFLSANVPVLVLRRDRVEHDHFRVWTVIPILASPPASCCSRSSPARCGASARSCWPSARCCSR